MRAISLSLMSRSLTLTLALTGMLAVAGAAHAGETGAAAKARNGARNGQLETIRANVQRLSPRLRVDAVRPLTEIPGLYEVRAGNQIFYSDATGEHLISGHIFRTADHRDITAARLEDINRVDWKSLPLADAIVSGDPKGTPVAVFTDPECPFCKRLEQELRRVKGLKVYTFLFPLTQIHPRARAKAEAIWCAKDRHKAMLDIMLNGKSVQDVGARACATPIDRNLALGEKLGITGTPTLIAHDGRKHAGVMGAAELARWAEGGAR